MLELMKKWIVRILVALSSLQAVHANMDFYIGGTMGIGIPEIRYSQTVISPDERLGDFDRGGAVTFLGGAVLGLENTWNNVFSSCLWTAIETKAYYNSFNKVITTQFLGTNYTPRVKVRVKNNFLYGADFKLGMPISCYGVTPYILLGVQAGKWRTTLSNDTFANEAGIPGQGVIHFGKTHAAPNVGGGIRFQLLNCATADLEYSYSWFTQDCIMLPLDADEYTHQVRVYQNKILFTVSFPFYSLSCWHV